MKGEIGKGRIIFDVQEYTLIMFLNKDWDIKQIMVIFATEEEHKHFIKSISGRALTFISKELKKITQKNKMITYKKDDIFVYDNREFIKYERANNPLLKKLTIKNKDNKENEQLENLNKKGSSVFEKQTNFFEPIILKEKKSNLIKGNIQIKEYDDDSNNNVKE